MRALLMLEEDLLEWGGARGVRIMGLLWGDVAGEICMLVVVQAGEEEAWSGKSHISRSESGELAL